MSIPVASVYHLPFVVADAYFRAAQHLPLFWNVTQCMQHFGKLDLLRNQLDPKLLPVVGRAISNMLVIPSRGAIPRSLRAIDVFGEHMRETRGMTHKEALAVWNNTPERDRLALAELVKAEHKLLYPFYWEEDGRGRQALGVCEFELTVSSWKTPEILAASHVRLESIFLLTMSKALKEIACMVAEAAPQSPTTQLHTFQDVRNMIRRTNWSSKEMPSFYGNPLHIASAWHAICYAFYSAKLHIFSSSVFDDWSFLTINVREIEETFRGLCNFGAKLTNLPYKGLNPAQSPTEAVVATLLNATSSDSALPSIRTDDTPMIVDLTHDEEENDTHTPTKMDATDVDLLLNITDVTPLSSSIDPWSERVLFGATELGQLSRSNRRKLDAVTLDLFLHGSPEGVRRAVWLLRAGGCSGHCIEPLIVPALVGPSPHVSVNVDELLQEHIIGLLACALDILDNGPVHRVEYAAAVLRGLTRKQWAGI